MSCSYGVLKRRLHRTLLAVLLAGSVAMPALGQDLAETLTDMAGVPEIPAFLPDRYSEAATTPLPIDGLWRINTIRKKVRIEAGRVYAVDGWLHLFVLRIKPDMVVMRNVERTGVGEYRADDLPLMGPATLRLGADGNLNVSVQSTFGPVQYKLQRLEPQYPEAFQAELASAGQRATPPRAAPPVAGPAPSPAPAPLPGMPTAPPPAAPAPVAPLPVPAPAPVPAPTADCKPIGIDPDTGVTICA